MLTTPVNSQNLGCQPPDPTSLTRHKVLSCSPLPIVTPWEGRRAEQEDSGLPSSEELPGGSEDGSPFLLFPRLLVWGMGVAAAGISRAPGTQLENHGSRQPNITALASGSTPRVPGPGARLPSEALDGSVSDEDAASWMRGRASEHLTCGACFWNGCCPRAGQALPPGMSLQLCIWGRETSTGQCAHTPWGAQHSKSP